MAEARWNGAVIAKSDDTVVVEGNHYFPPDTVNRDLLLPSDTASYCGWKGEAAYRHIEVNGERNADAAWFYPDPKPEAESIRDHVAFWKGVAIVADEMEAHDQTPGGAAC